MKPLRSIISAILLFVCPFGGQAMKVIWVFVIYAILFGIFNTARTGTAEKMAEVEAALLDGSLHVFDCSTWTVGGETLTSYDQVAFYEGHECIWDGYFHESETRSAPYFDIIIDGITVLG